MRLSLKATVANLKVKKPAEKWLEVGGESYPATQPDPETGIWAGIRFSSGN